MTAEPGADRGIALAALPTSDSALFETLVLESPVAFAFYDPQLRYRRVNRALAEINGLPAEAHIGLRPSEVLEPALGAAVEQVLASVIASRRSIVAQDFSGEAPPGSGEIKHWQSSWYPASAPDGSLLGVAVVIVDVTERHRTEEALRRSTERTLLLQQATAELATALTEEQVSHILTAIGRRTVGAASASVGLLHGGVLRFPPSATGPGVVPLDRPWPSAVAARTGRPVYATSRADLAPADDLPVTAESAWAALPLLGPAGPIGVLRLAFDRERRLTAEERVFLEALAGQSALALERARLFEAQRRVATDLQQALLPDRLPRHPALELAARYLPGTDASVGGDWYDAFEVPGGRMALVLGDVMGRGTTAAAGMGRVRSAVRALALSDPAPARVLDGLDRLYAATEGEEQIATMTMVTIDLTTGAAVVGDAGHLPVLLIPPAGPPRLVDLGPATTPLGLPEQRVQHEVQVGPGDTLIAFSDGLVERRGVDLDDALEDLAAYAGRHRALPLERLVDRIVSHLAGAAGREDDVSLLAARRPCGGH